MSANRQNKSIAAAQERVAKEVIDTMRAKGNAWENYDVVPVIEAKLSAEGLHDYHSDAMHALERLYAHHKPDLTMNAQLELLHVDPDAIVSLGNGKHNYLLDCEVLTEGVDAFTVRADANEVENKDFHNDRRYWNSRIRSARPGNKIRDIEQRNFGWQPPAPAA